MQTIGVFFGSRSPEHDVSIITGQLIIDGLKKLNYNVVPVYISKNGKWYLGGELDKLSNFKDSNNLNLKGLDEYYLDMQSSFGKMVFKQKGLLGGKEMTIDLAFPAFHGSYGEDGTVQGLFEMFNIPYIGCDVASSAIAMDKVLNKLLYRAENIPTTPFLYSTKEEWTKDKTGILEKIKSSLNWPLMVKPPKLGSSIGITKVKETQELEFAIDVALHYDTKVLVEEAVEYLMDITCAVIGNDDPIPSLLQESVFSKDFFNYEDKYLNDGGAQLGQAENSLVIPARLNEDTTKAIQAMAIKVYKSVGCQGTARVDFLYDKVAKQFYANELNPLPGTLYHHLWKASGIEFEVLLTKLIQYAQERQLAKEKVTFSFESTILQQANSTKLQNRKK